jgi:hypothetical protein
MPGDDGGDVLRDHSAQVQMRLCGALFDRGLGLGERLSGPRHPMEWDHGSGELGCGAGRGFLRPGARLPAERDLAAEYGVSADTVRRAIAVLRERALIVTLTGRGSYVTPEDQRP